MAVTCAARDPRCGSGWRMPARVAARRCPPTFVATVDLEIAVSGQVAVSVTTLPSDDSARPAFSVWPFFCTLMRAYRCERVGERHLHRPI